MKGYSYAIVTDNHKYLETLSVFLNNKYSVKKKYALISKVVNKDNSELIAFINYSNNLLDLHNEAKKYISWFNYPLGLYKTVSGEIKELNL
jgi:hypothetical protein